MRTLPLLLALVACTGGTEDTDTSVDTDTDTDAETDTDTDVETDTDTDTGGADADGDGFVGADDCNDSDANVFVGAPELCDAVDQDCDGGAVALAGTASFFPTTGAASDVTAAMSVGGWSTSESGALVLCGGTWDGAVAVIGFAAVTVQAAPAGLGSGDVPVLTGGVSLADGTAATLVGVNLWGAGVSATTGTASLTLTRVDLDVTGDAMTGPLAVVATELSGGATSAVANALDSLTLTDSTLDTTDGIVGRITNALVVEDTVIHADNRPIEVTGEGARTLRRVDLITGGTRGAMYLAGMPTLVLQDTTVSGVDDVSSATALVTLGLGNAAYAIDGLDVDGLGVRDGLRVTGAGSLTVANSSFVNMDGSGIDSAVTGGLTVESTEFIGTFASTFDVNDQALLRFDNLGGTLDVMDCSFTGGRGVRAGGIDVVNGTTTVTDSTFSDNRANAGSGAINMGFGNNALTVTDSVFEDNRGSTGGAIRGASSTTLDGSTFRRNQASDFGGAVMAPTGSLAVVDGTFTDNVGLGGGGALAANQNSNGSMTVTTSTLYRNTSNGGWGAAIGYGRSLVLTNCDLGTGVDDNGPNEISRLSGAPNLTGGAGLSATCGEVVCTL